MNFGVLVFPQVDELDFVGPWEMVQLWQQVGQGPKPWVVAESTAAVRCAKGLSINPDISFATCPPLDYLLVPGGEGTRAAATDPALLRFVADRAVGCQALLSVCTGAFVLHAAGLLSGKRATTHWASLGRLRALGDVEVVEERFVQDGRVWSSAGVSAGIDLTLRFIAQVAGEDVAGKVQFGSEYYPSTTCYGGFEHHAKAPRYVRESAGPAGA